MRPRSFSEAYALDGVETLGHVRLNCSWISRLRQYLQQLIVRQEEKPESGNEWAGEYLQGGGEGLLAQ